MGFCKGYFDVIVDFSSKDGAEMTQAVRLAVDSNFAQYYTHVLEALAVHAIDSQAVFFR